MSQGTDLLSKIIQEANFTLLTRVNRAWLVNEEIALYDRIYSYYTQHGVLPSTSALIHERFSLNHENVPEPASHYFDIVVRRHNLTQLSALQLQIRDATNNRDSSSINSVISKMRGIVNLADSLTTPAIATNFIDEARLILESSRNMDFMGGVTTGYEILDDLLNGWQNTDMNVFLGRPGAGKTYVMLHSAIEAWKAGKSVYFASMELARNHIAGRMLGMISLLNPSLIQKKQIPSFAQFRLEGIVDDLARNRPNSFHLTSGDFSLTTDKIGAAIDHYNPDVVFIDSAYLLNVKGGKSYSRTDDIRRVSGELKSIALTKNKPINVSVQLNRDADYKKGKKMSLDLSNIGDSDAWGRDASNVFAIYSPQNDIISKSFRDIDCLKVRDGELKKFKIKYQFQPPDFSFVGERQDDVESPHLQSEHTQTQARANLAAIGWSI